MTNHPITPPPELVQQWSVSSPIQPSDESWAYELFIAHQAAQWGADHELEAVEEEIITQGWFANSTHRRAQLRAARRPKSPSLKEQALLQLDTLSADLSMHGRGCDLSQIRRALEQLNG
jgi:hypothetical protein